MRVVGVDWGERRVGFAVADPMGSISLPLRTEEVASPEQAVQAVIDVCAETGAELVVVGLPLNMDGSEGPMAAKVRGFIGKLKTALDVPVEHWDERLSSSMVERVLLEADMSRKKRKKVRDKLAAQVILQGYLDARSAGLARSSED